MSVVTLDAIEQKARVERILRVYASAGELEKAEGLEWYSVAKAFAIGLEEKYNKWHPYGDGVLAAGVIAALSPQVHWGENMALAERAFRDGYATGHTGANTAKADRILGGMFPLDVLGGNKVRSFYDNIVLGESSTKVTIDRHAYDIANGIYTTEEGRAKVSGQLSNVTRYEGYADCYREAARVLHIAPCQAQAVVWCHWRNRKIAGLPPLDERIERDTIVSSHNKESELLHV